MAKKNNLNIAGLLAIALAVAGITILISYETPKEGVSADLGDLLTGEVVVMPQDDYQAVLDKLEDYFITTDKTSQDNIILDVVKVLESVQE